MLGAAGPTLRLSEALEDVRQEGRRDPLAGVAHAQLDVAVDRTDGDRDASASGRELHRVRKQVPGDLLDTVGVPQHRRPSGVLDHELVEPGLLLGQHLVKAPQQLGAHPLAVADVVEQPALRLFRREREGLVEGAVGAFDAEIAVQDDERLARGLDDRVRVVERTLQAVDVEEHHANPSCRFRSPAPR